MVQNHCDYHDDDKRRPRQLIAVGALVLTPVVPTAVAGLALTTFAGMLTRLYLKAPGLREEGSLQPTEQGTAIAKDLWMLAIGTALTIDGLTDRRSKRRKAKAATNGG